MVACATVTLGETIDDQEKITDNQPPNAPVVLKEKSGWEKNIYTCTFYAIDPEGDQVCFYIFWDKAEKDDGIVCMDDDPYKPWLGPFESGEEVAEQHEFCEEGKYEVRILVKDSENRVGPETTMTITYKKVKIFYLPILQQLLERFQKTFNLFREIFRL